jgi:hypothetical protein
MLKMAHITRVLLNGSPALHGQKVLQYRNLQEDDRVRVYRLSVERGNSLLPGGIVLQ